MIHGDTKNRYMALGYLSKDATHFNPTLRKKTSLKYHLLKGTSLNHHMIVGMTALIEPCFLIWKLVEKHANTVMTDSES